MNAKIYWLLAKIKINACHFGFFSPQSLAFMSNECPGLPDQMQIEFGSGLDDVDNSNCVNVFVISLHNVISIAMMTRYRMFFAKYLSTLITKPMKSAQKSIKYLKNACKANQVLQTCVTHESSLFRLNINSYPFDYIMGGCTNTQLGEFIQTLYEYVNLEQIGLCSLSDRHDQLNLFGKLKSPCHGVD